MLDALVIQRGSASTGATKVRVLMHPSCQQLAENGHDFVESYNFSNPRVTISDMAAAAPDVIRSPVMARHPQTATERRRAKYDALVKSLTHTNPNFCTPIAKAGDTKTTRATGAFASI